MATITIDNLVNHFLGLNEKCNMIGREDVVKEVAVHCDQNFRVFEFVTAIPNVHELLLNQANFRLGLKQLLNQVSSKRLLIVTLEKCKQVGMHFFFNFLYGHE